MNGLVDGRTAGRRGNCALADSPPIGGAGGIRGNGVRVGGIAGFGGGTKVGKGVLPRACPGIGS